MVCANESGFIQKLSHSLSLVYVSGLTKATFTISSVAFEMTRFEMAITLVYVYVKDWEMLEIRGPDFLAVSRIRIASIFSPPPLRHSPNSTLGVCVVFMFQGRKSIATLSRNHRQVKIQNEGAVSAILYANDCQPKWCYFDA